MGRAVLGAGRHWGGSLWGGATRKGEEAEYLGLLSS